MLFVSLCGFQAPYCRADVCETFAVYRGEGSKMCESQDLTAVQICRERHEVQVELPYVLPHYADERRDYIDQALMWDPALKEGYPKQYP